MINEINAYLDDMKLAWSPTTLRSERYRLSAVAEALDGDPANLWGLIQKRAPYTRVTIWTRVCRYWDWLIEGGHVNGKNHYKIFRAKNSRLFRNAYHRNHIRLSFDEVRARTKQIRFCDSQKKAQWLLANGLRFSEFSSLKADMVVGKGGRRREIYVTDLPRPTKRVNYGTFHRHLREVGLKP
ncbi:MAG: hypothetical protein KAS32_00860, partial [Candidatus Peribacteraceae bacterium]|nr:hypothetical protein [Candidatus Peribacteraceae bacterium]